MIVSFASVDGAPCATDLLGSFLFGFELFIVLSDQVGENVTLRAASSALFDPGTLKHYNYALASHI